MRKTDAYVPREYDPELMRSRPLVVGGIVGLVAIAASVIVSLPNGPVDIWGDLPDRSEAAIDNFYRGNISDNAQYQYQFLGRETWLKTGRGVLGFFEEKDAIGEDCLANTAFDTSPSEIRGGDISAVASITRNEDDEIIVHPANDSSPLVFTVNENGRLIASNGVTEQTLNSYGCVG